MAQHKLVPHGGDQMRCIRCGRIWDFDELHTVDDLPCEKSSQPSKSKKE